MNQKIMGSIEVVSDEIKRIKNFGVGVDIESIERFKKINIIKNKQFLDRVFTKNELDYCFSKKNPAPCLAARYAGKEAIVKALSSIGKVDVSYNMLEIFHNEDSAPNVRINGTGFSNLCICISLSHSQSQAIAFAAVMDIENE